jgi:NADH dehydrogenase [ubiquinone] 1 alpha subcomplex assembly factor 7
VFDQPGNSDLTANVDFAYLKESISSLGDVATYGPITQKDFLYRLGLEVRLSALIKAAQTEERKRDITSSAKRLVDPTGMGIQYKVLGVVGGGRKGSKKGEVWPFVQL